MLAAPAVEPYTYNQPNNEMAESNGYSSRPVSGAFSYNGPGSPNAGYSPVPATAGLAAAGAGAVGAGAYYGSSSGGPNQSSTSGGMSRGPSSASSYSNGSSSVPGSSAAGGLAVGGMSAAAAKRQEAQRERNRLHANGPSDVPEEDQPHRSGDNVVVHQDGGSVPNEDEGGDRVELPPVYGGWQPVRLDFRFFPLLFLCRSLVLRSLSLTILSLLFLLLIPVLTVCSTLRSNRTYSPLPCLLSPLGPNAISMPPHVLSLVLSLPPPSPPPFFPFAHFPILSLCINPTDTFSFLLSPCFYICQPSPASSPFLFLSLSILLSFPLPRPSIPPPFL
jgi:hypothetical protein